MYLPVIENRDCLCCIRPRYRNPVCHGAQRPRSGGADERSEEGTGQLRWPALPWNAWLGTASPTGTIGARRSVELLRPKRHIGVEWEISAVIVHQTTAGLNEPVEQSDRSPARETQRLK